MPAYTTLFYRCSSPSNRNISINRINDNNYACRVYCGSKKINFDLFCRADLNISLDSGVVKS